MFIKCLEISLLYFLLLFNVWNNIYIVLFINTILIIIITALLALNNESSVAMATRHLPCAPGSAIFLSGSKHWYQCSVKQFRNPISMHGTDTSVNWTTDCRMDVWFNILQPNNDETGLGEITNTEQVQDRSQSQNYNTTSVNKQSTERKLEGLNLQKETLLIAKNETECSHCQTKH